MIRGAKSVLLASALVPFAACSHDVSGSGASVDDVGTPHLVCNQQLDTEVSIQGSGFSPMPIDTVKDSTRLWLPQIQLTRSVDLADASVSDEPVLVPGSCPPGKRGEGCDDNGDESGEYVRWYDEQSMGLIVHEDLGLAEGVYDATVTNPNGAETQLDGLFVAVPPPTLESVEPMAICVAQSDVMLQFNGQGFLRRDVGGMTTTPTVVFESGSTMETISPDSLSGCSPLPAPATQTESCTTMTVTVSQDALAPDTYSVKVINPETAHCESTDEITVDVVPPPALDSISPTRICTGGGTIGLEGMNFREGASVSAGSVDASTVNVDAGGASATATFGSGLEPGTYDVTLTNPEGCNDTLTAALQVEQGPIMFWVDPPVAYNGISTQITIFVSGADASITEVALLPADGGDEVLLDDPTFDSARGRIQAVVPQGTAPGDYDVQARSAGGCDTTLAGGLTVTDDLSLTVDSISPEFGEVGTDTAVSIFGDGFVQTPRAYLNPDDPTADTVASPIENMAFSDATRLTGVVAAGLPADIYDLYVVNPDGTVGLLEDAFTVTSTGPPVIDVVFPGHVPAMDGETVTARGSGLSGTTASWQCQDPDDGSIVEPTGSVSASTDTEATVTMDAAALKQFTVCVLRLTNSDGAYGEYSAVSITTDEPESQNLREPAAGPDMTIGRRAPAAVTGRATRAARFLYAIGGDDGTLAGAHQSSESVFIDLFGQMGEWFEQPNPLPVPLTNADAVRVGRFIYLVGGRTGADAADVLSTTWRAEILDPRDSPDLVDLYATPGMGSGLGPGIWSYKVSAVFPSGHATNPDGESLPSDPLVVNLPDSIPDSVFLSIIWSTVDGAAEYRVYRTPAGDSGGSGNEELLTVIPAGDCGADSCEWQDDNSMTPSGDVPLPLGAHGTWKDLGISLNTARSGVRLGHATDPDVGEEHMVYLYAVGGDDGNGSLDSYEYLSIDTSTSPPTEGSWTEVSDIGGVRSEVGVYSVDHIGHPNVVPEGTTWIFLVGGKDGSTPLVDVRAAQVQGDGSLGAFDTSPTDLNAGRANAGFIALTANGHLHMLGHGPTPDQYDFSAYVDDPAPDFTAGGWQSNGFGTKPVRYLGDGAIESAHLYWLGGMDGTTAALATTRSTVW